MANTTTVWAGLGRAMQVFALDTASGALAPVQAVTMPAIIQYAWPNRAQTLVYVATSDAGPMVKVKRPEASVVVGELQAAIRKGDHQAALEAYQRVIGIFALNVWPGGTVRFLKTAMRLLGIPGSATRPPFEHLDEAATAIALRSMRALDLPEWRGKLPQA